jgi:hypothetical protein
LLKAIQKDGAVVPEGTGTEGDHIRLLNRGDIAVQRTANGLGESRSSCSR